MSPIDGVRPDSKFERLAREKRFQGRVVGVSTDRMILPNDVEVVHEVVHLPDAVCVVPLIESGDGTEVVLVEQFRGALSGHIYEIPAGILEKGEAPAACAARELAEETGYRAAKVTPLTVLCPTPGTSSHRMHFFLAEELTPGTAQLEPAECLRVEQIDFDNLLTSLLRSEPTTSDDGVVVVDAKTHLALLHVAWLREGKTGGGEASHAGVGEP